MSKLAEALEGDRFVVTCELNPPKGTELGELFEKADRLAGTVTAFNLTDSHASRMAMSPIAVAHLLLDRGAEPIVQLTTRDRNRIALQSDVLGASALGIENLVVMGGDPPTNGDHPDAKPVFDVFAAQLIAAVRGLESGRDMGGQTLAGSPRFCLGAVVNPGAPDLAVEIGRMEEKIEAGATFFQTQAVYEPASFERFADAISHLDVPVLAGIIPLKSQRMAEYLNGNVPGISIPDALIAEIAGSDDRQRTGVEMAARIAAAVRPMCRGLHVMAIGWEDQIPAILEGAEAA